MHAEGRRVDGREGIMVCATLSGYIYVQRGGGMQGVKLMFADNYHKSTMWEGTMSLNP